MSEAPFFAACTVSFLEPLSPEFQLQLSPVMMSGSLAETITKPVITRLLRNAVFSVRALLSKASPESALGWLFRNTRGGVRLAQHAL